MPRRKKRKLPPSRVIEPADTDSEDDSDKANAKYDYERQQRILRRAMANDASDESQEESPDEHSERIQGRTAANDAASSDDEGSEDSEENVGGDIEDEHRERIMRRAMRRAMTNDADSEDEEGVKDESDNDSEEEVESSDDHAEGSESDESNTSHEDVDETSTLTFEERLRLQKDGSAAQLNVAAESSDEEEREGPFKKKKRITKFKRRDKNAPMETTSKKPVSRHRQVVHVAKRENRDPRFTSWTGDFKREMFAKSFEFLNGYTDDEIKTLKKEMKKCRNPNEKKAMQGLLTQLQQYRSTNAQTARLDKQHAKWNKTRKEQLKKGQRPYYPKKRELRDERAKDQFAALEKSGKLERVMAKKRMKRKERKGRNKGEAVPWNLKK